MTEQQQKAIVEALVAIVMETVNSPAVRPMSWDSHLPRELVIQAIDALNAVGIDFSSWEV